jgi:CBS domain-containing protein
MNASDVMISTILSVRPDATIAEAIRLMLDNRISGLPVIDAAGRLVGILTEGDLLRRGETGTERHRPRWLEILMGPGRLAEEYVRTHGRKIGEVMTRDPVSVTPDTPLKEIVALMERHRIKRVPVLDGDVPVGILSRADLIRGLAGALEEKPVSAASDEEIRERILAELARAAWVPRDGIAITVENGVVDLNGVILDEKEREALRVAAENVPGVRAVEDHLVWVEPVSGTIIDAPPERRDSEPPAPGPGRPPR